MGKRGTYNGGSTIVGPRSGFFTFSKSRPRRGSVISVELYRTGYAFEKVAKELSQKDNTESATDINAGGFARIFRDSDKKVRHDVAMQRTVDALKKVPITQSVPDTPNKNKKRKKIKRRKAVG